jgi:hypothetical protein
MTFPSAVICGVLAVVSGHASVAKPVFRRSEPDVIADVKLNGEHNAYAEPALSFTPIPFIGARWEDRWPLAVGQF